MTLTNPVVAIIGRPNVGKSSLFNRLAGQSRAIVSDYHGLTRDCQYAPCHHEGKTFLLIDTGGIGEPFEKNDELASQITNKSMEAAREAGILIWVVDGIAGVSHIEQGLIKPIRSLNKPVLIAVNKLEGRANETLISEFFKLGSNSIYPISAKRGDGVATLMNAVSEQIIQDDLPIQDGIHIAIIGKPNVGKSTLSNSLVNKPIQLTSEIAGTTRDSVHLPITKQGQHYTIIDTAGIRKKKHHSDKIEQLSIIKSMASINIASIVIMVMDATEQVTEQDCRLLGIAAKQGKPIIVAINKWDKLISKQKQQFRYQQRRRLNFIEYAKYHYISALYRRGIEDLYRSITQIHNILNSTVSTSQLTKILQQAITKHPPKIVNHRRIKLRYAHLGGTKPFQIIIHGSQTDDILESYRRYLAKQFRRHLNLTAIPVMIEFKQKTNPFAKSS